MLQCPDNLPQKDACKEIYLTSKGFAGKRGYDPYLAQAPISGGPKATASLSSSPSTVLCETGLQLPWPVGPSPSPQQCFVLACLPGWGGSSFWAHRWHGGLQLPRRALPVLTRVASSCSLDLGAWKCMSEQCPTQSACHFLPHLRSLLSTEILWAGYKMGRHRAMDGRPQI